MYQNGQKSMKTSKLEDQYVIIFSLALWLEEPCEVHFFKKTGFGNKLSSENYKKMSKLSWNGSPWLRLGWYLARIHPNASRKLFKALPGPGEAIFDQFWPKSDKQKIRKFRIFSCASRSLAKTGYCRTSPLRASEKQQMTSIPSALAVGFLVASLKDL